MIKVVHGRLLCDHDQLAWLPVGGWCMKAFGVTRKIVVILLMLKM
jgi:hypothetical protein